MVPLSLAHVLTRSIDVNSLVYHQLPTGLARAFMDEFTLFGCAKIKLEHKLVDCIKASLAAGEEYFDLPYETKSLQKASLNGGAGYNAYESEQYAGEGRKEKREFFCVNRVKPGLGADTAIFSAAPRWPASPSAFRIHFGCFYGYADVLSQGLMRMIALECGAAPDFFDEMARSGAFSLRMFRYPAGRTDNRTLSLVSHKDSGFLTILFGVTTPGLEVRDPETGRYVPVILREDEALVIAGEGLDMVTGGRTPAPVHRVRSIPETGCDRLVIASFLVGTDDAPIQLIYPDEANAYLKENSAYARMTPLEFVCARLANWQYKPVYAAYDADVTGYADSALSLS